MVRVVTTKSLLAIGIVLLAPLVVAAPRAVTTRLSWSDVEPAVQSCFALADDGQGTFFASPDSSDPLPAALKLPESARRVIAASCEDATLRVGLAMLEAEREASTVATRDGRDAGTAALRRALFADERTARILRKVIAAGLEEAGFECVDCAVAARPGRTVSVGDFVPYLVRLCYVSADDLPRDGGPPAGFHVCNSTNDLRSLSAVDRDLAQVSLAALYVSMDGKGGRALRRLVRRDARTACPDTRGALTRAGLDALNAKLQARLAADRAFIAKITPALAREAQLADLSCGDCTAR